MRFAAIVLLSLGVLGLGAGASLAEKVEIKGPHICCKQCITVAEGLLNKIEGLTEVKADQKGKMISFTAKDEKAAKAGIQAIIDGGFYGACTCDGKEVPVAVAKGDGKADVVVVEKVHVCCPLCQKAINAIFSDSTVTYEGKGAQRTVRIEGKGLDRGAVLETLRKSGFNGILAK